MKFEPIKATLQGCINCSQVPFEVLEATEEITTGIDYGSNVTGVTIHIGDNSFDDSIYSDDGSIKTLQDIINKYRKSIEICDAFIVEFQSAMYGELYELNKDENRFYLVGRNCGWM